MIVSLLGEFVVIYVLLEQRILRGGPAYADGVPSEALDGGSGNENWIEIQSTNKSVIEVKFSVAKPE